ncbi:uncharacterized protein LOC122806373 [Protopterus annectens]|uniref:uncharacterized protein LOC122806373 n=1 Tax=Protopterus annectens TaxID=7888 RepID=UPI001CF9D14F|nr:uncharacterized protein LOC122806373 [Protopterus annectens]
MRRLSGFAVLASILGSFYKTECRVVAGIEGKEVSLRCNYNNTDEYQNYTKVWFKWTRPGFCYHVTDTNQSTAMRFVGRATVSDKKSRGYLILIVRMLQKADSGNYGCGALTPDGGEILDNITVKVEKASATEKPTTPDSIPEEENFIGDNTFPSCLLPSPSYSIRNITKILEETVASNMVWNIFRWALFGTLLTIVIAVTILSKPSDE